MVLPPEPKRKQPPSGCVVALAVLPFAGLAYVLTAPLAFHAMQALYWLAIMAAAISGLLAIRGTGGNAVAWSIVAGAYVAAWLDWRGVPFDPTLWRLVDVATALSMLGIRAVQRKLPTRGDWIVFALFLPAWWAYERNDYVAYVVTAAAVIAQCAVVVVSGRTRAVRSAEGTMLKPRRSYARRNRQHGDNTP